MTCGFVHRWRNLSPLLLAATALLLGRCVLVSAQECMENSMFGISDSEGDYTATLLPTGAFYVQASPSIPCQGHILQWNMCFQPRFVFRTTNYTAYPVVLRPQAEGVFRLVQYDAIVVRFLGIDSFNTICKSVPIPMGNRSRILVEDGDMLGLVLETESRISGLYYNTSDPEDLIRTCASFPTNGIEELLSTASSINCTRNSNALGLQFFYDGGRIDLSVDIEPALLNPSVTSTTSAVEMAATTNADLPMSTKRPGAATTVHVGPNSTPAPTPPLTMPTPGDPPLTNTNLSLIIGCSAAGVLLLLIAVLVCLICCVFCVRRSNHYTVIKQKRMKSNNVSREFSLNGMTLNRSEIPVGGAQNSEEIAKNGMVTSDDNGSRFYNSLHMVEQGNPGTNAGMNEGSAQQPGNYRSTQTGYESPQAHYEVEPRYEVQPHNVEQPRYEEQPRYHEHLSTSSSQCYEQPRETLLSVTSEDAYERPVDCVDMTQTEQDILARGYETPQSALEEYHKSMENIAACDERVYERPTAALSSSQAVSEELVSPYEQFTSSTPRLDEISEESETEEEGIYWQPPSTEEEIYESLQRRKYSLIAESEVKIVSKLGEGHFAKVHLGLWRRKGKSVQVAVKRLRASADTSLRVKFLQEAATMAQFKHPHIITVFGVVNTVNLSSPCAIIMEYMPHGDLKQHLRSLKEKLVMGMEEPDKVSDRLLGYSLETASAMNYLSNRSYVHRDIAARNILLDANYVSKIGDFGLSRELEESGYYKSEGGRIPVKWTAPEALGYKKYTQASDVWSYGCLLYEMWSLGEAPLFNIKKECVVQELLKGYRSPPPPGCPRKMYELMLNCWHSDPGSRPLFCEIYSLLEKNNRLLSWEEADIASVPIEALKLGGPLSDGADLFKELQCAYISQ